MKFKSEIAKFAISLIEKKEIKIFNISELTAKYFPEWEVKHKEYLELQKRQVSESTLSAFYSEWVKSNKAFLYQALAEMC